jgi:hypothetical protein
MRAYRTGLLANDWRPCPDSFDRDTWNSEVWVFIHKSPEVVLGFDIENEESPRVISPWASHENLPLLMQFLEPLPMCSAGCNSIWIGSEGEFHGE